jgi:hypothetical protein
VQRDGGLLAEALEHALVMRRERRRARRERGDDAEQEIAAHHRHAEHRADTFALVDVAPGRARIVADVVDQDRLTHLGAAPDDALAHRQLERAPLIGLEAVGGRLHQASPVGVEQRDAASRGTDERAHRPADALEDRREVEPRGDETARRVERAQLVLAPPAFVEQLEGRTELAGKIRPQARPPASWAADEDELSDGTPRGAERYAQHARLGDGMPARRTTGRDRAQPFADAGRQAPRRHGGRGLAARRTEDEQAALRAREDHDPAQGAFEPGLERGRRGEWPQEVGENPHG